MIDLLSSCIDGDFELSGLVGSEESVIVEYLDSLELIPLLKRERASILKDVVNKALSERTSPESDLVLSLLHHLSQISPINKIRLHSEALCQLLIDYCANQTRDSRDLLVLDFFESISELGLSFQQTTDLYKKAIQNAASALSFQRLFTKHLDSHRSYLFLPTSQYSPSLDAPIINCTIQFWFQYTPTHEQPSPSSLFVLNGKETLLTYSLENRKFSVSTLTDIATFEAFVFEPLQKYHVVFVHKEEKRRSYIDLYVNGDFVQSMNLAYKKSDRATSLDIQGIHGMYFELMNLLVLSERVSYGWILLSYHLGPLFAGTYQGYHLERCLSEKSKLVIKLKLQESMDSRALKDIMISPSSILVDINANSSAEIDSTIHWKPKLLLNSLYSIGGMAVCLRLLETAKTSSSLVESLDFLFALLSKDPLSKQEFEMNAGYNIVATILKTKKSLLNLTVLDSILRFVGYNDTSPIDSILANALAYRILIVDFEIWKPTSIDHVGDASVRDTFKFLLFQFSVFAHDSRYHSYNIQQLVDMRIIKRFVQAMKYGLFEEGVLPLLHDTISILVRNNPSTESIKALSLYVIYSLTIEDLRGLQRKCGLTVLRAIQSVVEDPALMSNVHGYKIIMKSISTKWILLLLDNDNADVVKISLRLLKRILLFSTKIYKSFADETSLLLLFKLLKKWDSNFEVMNLIMALAFRKQSTSDQSEVVMPEFLVLVNTILSESELDPGTISLYVRKIQHLLDSNIFFKMVASNHIQWLQTFLHLVCQIRNKHDISVIAPYKDFIGELFKAKLERNAKKTDSFTVDALHQKFPAAFTSTILPEILIRLNELDPSCRTQFVSKLLSRILELEKLHQIEEADYYLVLEKLSPILSFDEDPKQKTAKRHFCDFFTELLAKATFNEKESNGSALNETKTCCSVLMANQRLFSKYAGDENLSVIVASLFQCMALPDASLPSLALNCLRIQLMSDLDVRPTIACLSSNSSQRARLVDYFEKFLSLNDEEIRDIWENDFNLRNTINAKYESYILQIRKQQGKATIRKTMDELASSRLSDNNDKIEKLYSKEIMLLSKTIEQAETKKFNRHIQDDLDDLNYFVSVFNDIKSQLPVENYKFSTVLDSTEGPDRMRKRMIKQLCLTDDDIPTEESPGLEYNELAEEYGLLSEQIDVDLAQEDNNRKILRSLYVGDKIVEMLNVTQILGLETLESIFILGQSHIYMIGNYFLTSDKKVVDLRDAPPNERDSYVQLITGNNSRVPSSQHQTKTWELAKFASISKRTFLLRDVALELFFIDGSNFLITCSSKETRDGLFNILSTKVSAKYPDTILEDALTLASSSSLTIGAKLVSAITSVASATTLSSLTKKWQKGEISNFYYLILVNTLAGRTFNDLTQYPIFPFVIADYENEELDLTNPATFRDLGKPMGAQTEKRAAQFRERYDASADMSPDSPPFHYGTHYSSAMIVTTYLIRVKPFVQSYLLLQGGKFDHADRTFHSMVKTWYSASRDHTTDVRELIPEFYYLPDFLLNSNNFEFGYLQDGTKVGDVRLPPWAKNDPVIFVEKMRQALESDYVSEHLHEWIDLVFGFKQRGKHAVDSLNVFHHLSYQGSTDLDKIQDERERNIIVSIIHNFGQTPIQVFHKPHPRKQVQMKVNFDPSKLFELPLSIINVPFSIDTIEFDSVKMEWQARDRFSRGSQRLRLQLVGRNSVMVNNFIFENVSTSMISAFGVLNFDEFVIGFEDGTLQIYRLTSNKLASMKNAQKINVRQPAETSWGRGAEEVIQLGVLRGHRSKVCQVRINTFYSILLSYSEDGTVKLWDLLQRKLMRDVSEDGKLIEISNRHALIAVVDRKNTLRLETINGLLLLEQPLQEECLSITFGEANLNHFTNIEHHDWTHHSILALGFRGKIKLAELTLDRGWSIKILRELNMFGDLEITSLKLKLNVELNGEGQVTGRGELAAASRDKIMIWC
ncbi:hypothetical protein KL918_000670 [Ogataea parapolymorpha]|uniref:Beige/BEACH domain protein n=1 Tax=Ogataea parapolymorpha (strain ATCC 26012 / BCRC 20466 / JCM 22074 / NRRL Y-7560 / DL-1) TaxID=871575 RepID=W1Q9J9_OGAPD|nr:Beige/BEACH domain protein [Ogataea parapolymorpha DL-1]ESW97059.1 Beige/BEACH domain protein [Ogataea parapolymorpha DL-1]KAG7869125.1 hypothetical protein KL918_000670 [Ogataea parapolymorpha]KAG7875824.1 hypothetical protein KL916_000495 [Ogataea parapolymorpha]